ncbi:DNA polymerase IV [Sterolibacterium denitrificans]|uniref:DNA polymerase IV n=1 Tax=Sterolibacterium denitrificans TaxID=157592 RepID=A0A7Z7MUN6_9PROT|nr:DNA polymerase IV [Sterolibacterium denitrificans]SMB22029.1 DNA polymerase IV [Sterolibacterium denitrificans]
MSTRCIAHLDMDAYYASVELLRYPQLRGLPVAVGGRGEHRPQQLPDGHWQYARLRDYVGRGVLTTASYEARALGLHSGMGTMKAARLAPEAILLPADFSAYRHYSRLFKAAVRQIAPLIEDRGIDEIYIDLTALSASESAGSLARRIKAAVREATGLSCSIGIAPNKLLAKLCSELDKPDGITLLEMSELPTRIWPLPVGRINGIGPKAAARLAGLGIQRIGQLAAADPAGLVAQFGRSQGRWLHEVANGIDARPVQTEGEPKSFSRETTFERDLHAREDRGELGAIFTALCRQLAADLARHRVLGRTVGIKLRFDDFRTVTRDLSLPVATADAAAIRQAAGLCLKRVPLERRLRLLGVRMGSLQSTDRPQAELPLLNE